MIQVHDSSCSSVLFYMILVQISFKCETYYPAGYLKFLSRGFTERLSCFCLQFVLIELLVKEQAEKKKNIFVERHSSFPVVDLGVEAAQKSTSEKSGTMRLTIVNP